jgi:hypothetical protein
MSKLYSENEIKELKERIEEALQDLSQTLGSKEAATEAIMDCLDQLDKVYMTGEMVELSGILKPVKKCRKQAGATGERASKLLEKWRLIHEQWAQVKRKLDIFREELRRLKSDNESKKYKPDMTAYSNLHAELTPPRKHGEIPGVPVGLKLQGRGEAAILGIHRNIMRGIDTCGGNACYAICLSGRYADDDDDSPDGTITYTGSGGQKNGRQVEDQTENADNRSLLRSIATRQPIRVLRGGKVNNGRPVYVYDGLYECTGHAIVPSVDGPKVYVFTLKPIPGKSIHSFKVRPQVSGSNDAAAVGVARGRNSHPEERERKRRRLNATKKSSEVS